MASRVPLVYGWWVIEKDVKFWRFFVGFKKKTYLCTIIPVIFWGLFCSKMLWIN